MRVKGWHNGRADKKQPAGYGVRFSKRDRDAQFRREWAHVTVETADGQRTTVRASNRFWNKCPELRSSDIGRWLLDSGLAPWQYGRPPMLRLERIADRVFRLSRP